MLKTITYPWLYVVELFLWAPLMLGFYFVNAFLGSTPVNELELHGASLPAGWEAAILNHGKYLEGYIIGHHPLAFAGVLLLCIGSALVIYFIRKAQRSQMKESGPAAAKWHVAANVLLMVVLLGSSYLVITHVLVGISPV